MKSALLVIAISLSSILQLFAQEEYPQLIDDANESVRPWYAIRNVKAQFAGNQGFLSIGAGISVAKEKFDVDLFAGYVPDFIGDRHITMLTLKGTYSPFSIALGMGEETVLRPLSIGTNITYIHGNQYEFRKFDSYYWWSSSMRFWLYFGGRIDTRLADNGILKDVGFYYEIGTNDLYLISYLQNIKSLDVTDIASLALGVRFGIR